MAVIGGLEFRAGRFSGKATEKALGQGENFAQTLERERGGQAAGSTASESSRVALGVISPRNPTVSHLLANNRELSKSMWDIVHNEQNNSKDFTRMPAGTRVWLDKATGEIGWSGAKKGIAADQASRAAAASHVGMKQTPYPDQGAPADLVSAVSRDMGKPYADVDCYELVVRGLGAMGVQYGGRSGVKQALVDLAAQRHRPANAYLTGEGLVSLCGTKLFQKTFAHYADPDALASKVMDQLSKRLEAGGILSVSTRTKGHTGVVASRDGRWTFINSGNMDNPVENGAPRWGVGEEDLEAELANWFRLAKNRGEALSITLGVLAPDKLQAFSAPKSKTFWA